MNNNTINFADKLFSTEGTEMFTFIRNINLGEVFRFQALATAQIAELNRLAGEFGKQKAGMYFADAARTTERMVAHISKAINIELIVNGRSRAEIAADRWPFRLDEFRTRMSTSLDEMNAGLKGDARFTEGKRASNILRFYTEYIYERGLSTAIENRAPNAEDQQVFRELLAYGKLVASEDARYKGNKYFRAARVMKEYLGEAVASSANANDSFADVKPDVAAVRSVAKTYWATFKSEEPSSKTEDFGKAGLTGNPAETPSKEEQKQTGGDGDRPRSNR